MAKTSGGSHQSFSLRRLILQRARISESRRNNILNDVESGLSKYDYSEKGKNDLNSLNNTNTSSEQLKKELIVQFSGLNSVKTEDACYCAICFLKESERKLFFPLELCGHKFCISCLVKYLKNEIIESRTDIACPQCSFSIHPNNIYYLLKDFPDFIHKYEDFMMRRYLVSDPDSRWCPAPDCGYAVIANGCASCPQLQCQRASCGISFCYHCKAEWHPNQTCDAARISRQNMLRTPSIKYSSNRNDEVKPCPKCQVLIAKMDDGSCNHMICSVCGTEFCWLCMKEVSDLHYLSPSGCTFWGKKPWSRKKKIVWQIGTLIGAPVGIALLAGIAIPSMVIGIPVWVGRKLLNKYKGKTRQKRNISVTIGVTASILISPLLAGLVIAIGVPILLFYVYGVVPVSLCRAGCDTSRNEDFEFDDNVVEDNQPQCNSNSGSLDAVSKIGETSIGDVSLSATSASLVEVMNNNGIYNAQRSYRESKLALAGSVNQRVDCLDDFSLENSSVNTCNSEKLSAEDNTFATSAISDLLTNIENEKKS